MRSWGLAVTLALVGCGRAHFDPLDDASTLDDPVDTIDALAGPVAHVTTDQDGTCAIDVSGAMRCWGGNYSGDLGQGDYNIRLNPTDVPGDWIAVDGANERMVAIARDGTVFTAGAGYSGELGFGDYGDRKVMTMLAMDPLIAASISNFEGAGITASGARWAWGRNDAGSLGTGDMFSAEPPVVTTQFTDWTAISQGNDTTCGLRGTALWCWGQNASDLLGVGPGLGQYILQPLEVVGGYQWRSVSVGSAYTCGIQLDGSLWCWGDNYLGRLGDGTQTNSPIPLEVSAGPWLQVSAGNAHTCAIDATHALYCWGINTKGELGVGDKAVHLSPTQVSGNNWASVDTEGFDHACGITLDNHVWCWGDNISGQLGTGDKLEKLTPFMVL